MELSEAETEYAVNVVKHIFDSHVVFQYNCTNTIPEQLLENVWANSRKIVFFSFLVKLHPDLYNYFCLLPGHCCC